MQILLYLWLLGIIPFFFWFVIFMREELPREESADAYFALVILFGGAVVWPFVGLVILLKRVMYRTVESYKKFQDFKNVEE